MGFHWELIEYPKLSMLQVAYVLAIWSTAQGDTITLFNDGKIWVACSSITETTRMLAVVGKYLEDRRDKGDA